MRYFFNCCFPWTLKKMICARDLLGALSSGQLGGTGARLDRALACRQACSMARHHRVCRNWREPGFCAGRQAKVGTHQKRDTKGKQARPIGPIARKSSTAEGPAPDSLLWCLQFQFPLLWKRSSISSSNGNLRGGGKPKNGSPVSKESQRPCAAPRQGERPLAFLALIPGRSSRLLRC